MTAALLTRCIRLRARRLALWMEHCWAEAGPGHGQAITSGEVDRLLREPAEEAAAQARFHSESPEAAALAEPIAAADDALATNAAWARLIRAFALSRMEGKFLSVLLATAFNPALQRVIAYLHDDPARVHPTPWLAARLFAETEMDAAYLDWAGLLRWRLAQPTSGAAQHPGTAWQPDPALLPSLATGTWNDPALAGCVSIASAAFPCLHPAALEGLTALGLARDIALVGPEGIGRQTLAAQFAASLGRELLVVDSKLLLAGPQAPDEQMIAVLRMARHRGAIPYWRDAELIPPTTWARATALGCRMLRGCKTAGQAGGAVTLDLLSTRMRHVAWAHHSEAPPPDIVTTQRLTPGEIALCARATAGGTDAMRAALRRAMPVQNELLTLLPCPYEWDDLVLHEDLRRQLRELENQVRLRWAVMEEWGFSRQVHLGQGISALFGGPSGTGKTMAAQVLARALGLDLYRVDLAGVVNKYIGETEKRLRDVFAACERAGTLLFFDEADALFGSRMQVKDSHDRFANIEIDYLLQRIEQFDGVAILATNRKSDLDAAFLRRLRFVVDFLAPRPDERLALWRKALPQHTPSGEKLLEDIDFTLLAERLQVTGADIKSAALAAAYLARAEGCRIGMRHVLAAAQRELAKHGTPLRVAWRGVGT
jgi:hypothetical protein